MFLLKKQGAVSYFVAIDRKSDSIVTTHERGYAKLFASETDAQAVIERVAARQASRKFHEKSRLAIVRL